MTSIAIAFKFFVILNLPSLSALACNGIALGPGAEQEEHGPRGPRCVMLPSIGRTGNASPCFGKKKCLLGEVVQLTALTARYVAKALITQACGDQMISYFLNSELKDFFLFLTMESNWLDL